MKGGFPIICDILQFLTDLRADLDRYCGKLVLSESAILESSVLIASYPAARHEQPCKAVCKHRPSF